MLGKHNFPPVNFFTVSSTKRSCATLSAACKSEWPTSVVWRQARFAWTRRGARPPASVGRFADRNTLVVYLLLYSEISVAVAAAMMFRSLSGRRPSRKAMLRP